MACDTNAELEGGYVGADIHEVLGLAHRSIEGLDLANAASCALCPTEDEKFVELLRGAWLESHSAGGHSASKKKLDVDDVSEEGKGVLGCHANSSIRGNEAVYRMVLDIRD